MNKELKKYPLEIQEEVKDTLGAFDRCYVIREFGEYHVSTNIVIASKYAEDYTNETFYAKDVLSKKERMIAYINNFYSFPSSYKGVRDYKMLNQAQKNKEKLVLDSDGNLVLA